jgi:hypothetical protein
MSEQLVYARWLEAGTRVGFVVLAASFVAYVFGLLDPLVWPQELARLWNMPVDRFVATSGAPTGWRWLHHLARGDYLNLIGVAVLCLVTVFCYARILPLLWKGGDRLYAALAIAQIVVLLIAASGFVAGHG